MVYDESFPSVSAEEIEHVRQERAKRQGYEQIDSYTKVEKPKSLGSFEELKKQIAELGFNKNYKHNLIRANIRQKAGLRKAYLSLINHSPARVQEFSSSIVATKKTIYNQLYELIKLGLCEKVSVMDLYLKKQRNAFEEVVLKKFEDWTCKMNKGMLQYYMAKTNYFILSELGKDTTLMSWALQSEKELRGTETEVKN